MSSGFNDLASTSITPEITAHVIKQNSSRSPVSLSISAGFARDNYSSPDLDAESFTIWANTILVGGTVYRDVPVVAGLTLQLVLRPGLTFDKDNTTFAISLGLVVALNKPGAPSTP